MKPQSRAPDLLLLASTLLWGTLWIPLRHIDAAGSGAAAATCLSLLLPWLGLLPLAALRTRTLRQGGVSLVLDGLFLAASIALYAEGLVRGTVARVILLFYLTPVWSTLLGWWVLGEPITRRRVATLVCGLCALLVLFGAEAGVPLPRTAADWMGLVGGMSWAVAMTGVRRAARASPFEAVFVQFAFLGPAFLLLAVLPGRASGLALDAAALQAAGPWLLAFGPLWMLPAVWLTVFAASRLDPGRVAILLLFEIVVGLGTAALLTSEPFGLRELLGALLILAATATEIGSGRASPGPA